MSKRNSLVTPVRTGKAQPKRSRRNTVAFKGEPGNFTEAAAKQHFDRTYREEIDTRGFTSFLGVFNCVKEGSTDYGIVPIENSASGTLHSVYDELLNSELFVVGECSRLEEHCLCAPAGTTKEEITNIISHPAMFEQCSEFLSTLDATKQISREAFWDTSGACSKIKNSGHKNAAAICAREAAYAHRFTILEEGIGNDKNNETRYLLIARKEYELPELTLDSRIKMKCSIAVALKNEPNALFRMVSCFGIRNINIHKMESRPAATAAKTTFKATKDDGSDEDDNVIKHWDYIFYVDFEPSWSKRINENLMNSLVEFSMGVRNFGNYVENLPDVVALHSPWHGVADLSAY